MTRIIWSEKEMACIAVLESTTGVLAQDCFVHFDTPIFLVRPEDYPRVAHLKQKTMRKIIGHLGCKPIIACLEEEPEKFIMNFFGELVDAVHTENGQAIIVTKPSNIKLVVGKEGRRANLLRFILNKYYEISAVKIVDSEPYSV